MKRYVPDMFPFVEDYGKKESLFPDIVVPTKESVAPIKEKDILEANIKRNTFDIDNKYLLVTEVNTQWSPRIKAYSLGKGTTGTLKINKNVFRNTPVRVGDVIFADSIDEKSKMKPSGQKNGSGKPIFVEGEGVDYWITSYNIVTDFSGFKRKVIR